MNDSIRKRSERRRREVKYYEKSTGRNVVVHASNIKGSEVRKDITK